VAINPRTFPAPGISAPTDARLDQFLARKLFARGERLSVGDLIKQVAHIDGAVHKGKPTNARAELLDEMSRFMFFRDLPATLHDVQLSGGSSYEHSLRSATRSLPTKVRSMTAQLIWPAHVLFCQKSRKLVAAVTPRMRMRRVACLITAKT
jgi:hypothetical protein